MEGEVDGEVEVGGGAPEAEQRGVVGARGGLGGLEGAEPHPYLVRGVLDLRHPPPRRPLPDAHEALPSPLCSRRGADRRCPWFRPCRRRDAGGVGLVVVVRGEVSLCGGQLALHRHVWKN